MQRNSLAAELSSTLDFAILSEPVAQRRGLYAKFELLCLGMSVARALLEEIRKEEGLRRELAEEFVPRR
jgi:hypothetical protein